MWQRFLKLWALLFLGILLSGILLCVIINPFHVYNAFGKSKISQDAHFHHYFRLATAYQLITEKPSILIIGNSRIDKGLDQHHPGLSHSSENVYKAIVPGASMYEIYQYIRHANFNNKVSMVVIGLDFSMFHSSRLLAPDYDNNRLNFNNNRQFWKYYSAYFLRETMLTDAALWASLKKVMSQTVSSQDEHELQQKIGYHRRFKIMEYKIWDKLKPISSMPGKSNSQRGRYNFIQTLSVANHIKNINAFKNLLTLCSNDQINLVLFINPLHARYYEMLRATNNWKKFEALKKTIVQSINNNLGPTSQVELWDFSGYNSITTEPVPASDDKVTHMFGYWEASHYKRAVGNLILDKIFFGPSKFKDGYEDFGYRIDSRNIDEHLAWIRKEQSNYKQQHLTDFQDIESLKNIPN